MSDKYISANAFKTRIREQQMKCARPGDTAVFIVFSLLLQAVDEEPAADVQPVKLGKWKKRMSTSDSVKCSVCGNSHEYETTYCPNCGARMDGDVK